MLTAILFLAVAVAGLTLVLGRCSVSVAKWSGALLGMRTESDLAQLFVFVSAGRLLLSAVVLAALLIAVAFWSGLPFALLPVVGLSGLAVPRLLVWWLTTRRRRGIARQLPDALALWSGLLQSGQSTTQSLAQVAARQGSPLGDELRMVLAQLRLGIGIEVAFRGLHERAGLPDLRLLATLMQAHRELGGNLAESLHRLAELLRTRLVMEARIASLTSQGRLQGVVVGLLPILLLAALYFMEGETMKLLHSTPQGWAALGLIAILELVGFLLIRRIVKIDV